MKILTSRNIVGCKIKNRIYVHPELKDYPSLYNVIIEHEKKHGNGFSLDDVKIDLFNDELSNHKKEYYSFIWKHPRTLLGFLPITKVGDVWAVDIGMILMFLVAATVTVIVAGSMI